MMFLLTLINLTSAHASDESARIAERMDELQKTLLSRKSPAPLLSPLLSAEKRDAEVESAKRAYVRLEFLYNSADVEMRGPDHAELPFKIEWGTPRETGSMTGTAKFVRVNGDWYFASFSFLVFPWIWVVLGSMVGVAFAALMLYLFYRSKHRRSANLHAN